MTIKYEGTFTIPEFKNSSNPKKDEPDEDMEEAEDVLVYMKSHRKKNALEISKRSHLIKKKLKQEKAKERRQEKISKASKKMRMRDD
mmetsp:Transcript_27668/g.73097  ORF Transcript_27668/g.73097 Transcript_27668/m.73097 type:complete len:87 (-) Transcript_27668:63-323(-)